LRKEKQVTDLRVAALLALTAMHKFLFSDSKDIYLEYNGTKFENLILLSSLFDNPPSRQNIIFHTVTLTKHIARCGNRCEKWPLKEGALTNTIYR
jgi:hypothetical protein